MAIHMCKSVSIAKIVESTTNDFRSYMLFAYAFFVLSLLKFDVGFT